MANILSMLHVENTEQLKKIMQGFGHFLPPEQRQLIEAIINEVDKGENMNKDALRDAAAYLSSGITESKEELKENIGEEKYNTWETKLLDMAQEE